MNREHRGSSLSRTGFVSTRLSNIEIAAHVIYAECALLKRWRKDVCEDPKFKPKRRRVTVIVEDAE